MMHFPQEIETWPIGKLQPYEANARIHSKEQVAKIAESMKEFGWTIPILATSEGEIIAGHGRLMAAQELDMDEVPVLVADHLTEDQRRAYRLVDNRLTEIADWNEAFLAEEVRELAKQNVEIENLGFTRAEIDAIIAENTPPPIPALPAPPKNPVIEEGQLWKLGDHRLLCAQPNESSIRYLMDSERADLLATEPPDMQTYESVLAIAIKEAINTSAALYAWITDENRREAESAWRESKILMHQTIIWDKTVATDTGTHYHQRHQPCLYGWIKGNRPLFASHKIDNATVWKLPADGESKPPEIFAIPMRKHVKRGGIAFEPFNNQGSQIIAGQQTGRRVFAIETDPARMEATIERWESDSEGELAEREDGKTLAEIRGGK